MMINRRLIGTVPQSTRYIAGNVALQWICLAANIGIVFSIAGLLQQLWEQTANFTTITTTGLTMIAALFVRFLCTAGAAGMSHLSSCTVKSTLRKNIYEKLLRLGVSYREHAATSEVVQVAVEGVDQLETYFGAYLPQFFYSMLASLTLFIVLCFVSAPAAIVLLVCVPLIPITIAAIQTFAKKLLAKYWGQYTALGDTFLENLQGLTTLKIYGTDEFKAVEMDMQAEKFRKITMKVLTMQLNSVTVMDVIAYGGAALGVILAVNEYRAGSVGLSGALSIILLSADFFIPMRLLGSYFHIAMNGMAASDKIFRLLDLPESSTKETHTFPQNAALCCKNVCFSYEPNREILHRICMNFPAHSFTAIVGESGSGKSTIAFLLSGRRRGFTGSITAGGVSLGDVHEASLLQNITYVGFDGYLFKGTVRENLLLGNPNAEDSLLWEVLNQVNLADFVRTAQGLDTLLTEKGSNFSGGQRQRLALARAILHDSPIYIFDEATSNVDVESEHAIVEQIQALAARKTVILITHRLASARNADSIYVMERGSVVQHNSHNALLLADGLYARLWAAQIPLERYAKETAS